MFHQFANPASQIINVAQEFLEQTIDYDDFAAKVSACSDDQLKSLQSLSLTLKKNSTPVDENRKKLLDELIEKRTKAPHFFFVKKSQQNRDALVVSKLKRKRSSEMMAEMKLWNHEFIITMDYSYAIEFKKTEKDKYDSLAKKMISDVKRWRSKGLSMHVVPAEHGSGSSLTYIIYICAEGAENSKTSIETRKKINSDFWNGDEWKNKFESLKIKEMRQLQQLQSAAMTDVNEEKSDSKTQEIPKPKKKHLKKKQKIPASELVAEMPQEVASAAAPQEANPAAPTSVRQEAAAAAVLQDAAATAVSQKAAATAVPQEAASAASETASPPLPLATRSISPLTLPPQMLTEKTLMAAVEPPAVAAIAEITATAKAAINAITSAAIKADQKELQQPMTDPNHPIIKMVQSFLDENIRIDYCVDQIKSCKDEELASISKHQFKEPNKFYRVYLFDGIFAERNKNYQRAYERYRYVWDEYKCLDAFYLIAMMKLNNIIISEVPASANLRALVEAGHAATIEKFKELDKTAQQQHTNPATTVTVLQLLQATTRSADAKAWQPGNSTKPVLKPGASSSAEVSDGDVMMDTEEVIKEFDQHLMNKFSA